MTFFNPEEEYWGNSTDLTIGTYTNRLTSRSVKIFADGEVIQADTGFFGLNLLQGH